MKSLQTIRRQFWLSIGLLTGMSATFLLMPWASSLSEATAGWSIRLAGVLFWLLAIAGYGTVIKANKNRKAFVQMEYGHDVHSGSRPGALRVFSNRYAKIADIMLAIFAAAFAVSIFTRLKNTYYVVVMLSLLIWAANMHCLFNGRTYEITKYIQKERKTQ